MAKLYGNDYMLWVESTTPGTYNLLKGQTNLTESRSRPSIDTSDKTTSGYSTGSFGNQSLSLSCDVNVDLPDTTGYTRIETNSNAKTAIKCQVRKGGAAGATPADVVLEATWFASLSNKNFPKDGVVNAKVDLALASQPTIDLMA